MADFTESVLGKVAGNRASADVPAGQTSAVYAVPRMGWFVRNWGDRRGPYLSRELAENELTRMCTTDPGLAETWIEVARVIGVGLLCSSVLLAGVLFLVLVAQVLGWWLKLL